MSTRGAESLRREAAAREAARLQTAMDDGWDDEDDREGQHGSGWGGRDEEEEEEEEYEEDEEDEEDAAHGTVAVQTKQKLSKKERIRLKKAKAKAARSKPWKRLNRWVGGWKFWCLYLPLMVLAFGGGLGCGCSQQPQPGGVVDRIGTTFDGANHHLTIGQGDSDTLYTVPSRLAGKFEILTPEEQLAAIQTMRVVEERARADAFSSMAASVDGLVKNADEVAQRAAKEAESMLLQIVERQRNMPRQPLTQSGPPVTTPAFNRTGR